MNANQPDKPAMHLTCWIVIAGIGVVALVVGRPFLYFRVIADDPPPPLTLTTSTPTETSTSGGLPVDGKWTVASGSQVGYRVKEVLFGQSQDAVGRTTKVEG